MTRTATSPPTPTPAPANLLTNPGFETSTGWLSGFWTTSKGTAARTTTTKHSGSYSFRLDGDSSSSGGQVYSDIANRLTVTPGQGYRFTAWYKGKKVWLVLKWFDSAGNELTAHRLNAAQPDSAWSWREGTAEAVAPAGAAAVWVFAQTRDNAEAVYFDDLEFGAE